MGLYCMENLHYCIHECCHCSIMGHPSVRSLVAIKGGWEAFARSTNILTLWLVFGVLALTLLKFVESFPAKDARRELASDKRSPCYLILPLPRSHWIHSRHHVLASSNEASSLWTGCRYVCRSFGVTCFWVPKNWHLWYGDLILSQHIQGEGEILRKMLQEDLRGDYCNLPPNS